MCLKKSQKKLLNVNQREKRVKEKFTSTSSLQKFQKENPQSPLTVKALLMIGQIF
jgi:hypothetical protein